MLNIALFLKEMLHINNAVVIKSIGNSTSKSGG
jgi:hypothetical protein